MWRYLEEGGNGEQDVLFKELAQDIHKAVLDLGGYPCFLRTGHTSGKHSWKDTCFLQKEEDITSHVMNLVEYSAMASLLGFPADVWVVREFLPCSNMATAFHGEMPVTKEVRVFIKNGAIEKIQPYWPPDSLQGQMRGYGDLNIAGSDFYNLELTPISYFDLNILLPLISALLPAFPEYWSVDFLKTEDPNRPWVLIDMAQGEFSFSWDCSGY